MRAIIKLLRFSALPVLMVAAAIIFSGITTEMNSEKSERDREKLYDSLTRAAVACYAVEGAYPPDVEYLIENYRVRVDSDRYTVKYELYASNLMPSITVLENSES